MMATAGKVTIAEVEQLVEPGEIDPDQIMTPGIFVQRIVHVPNGPKRIEQRTVRKRGTDAAPAGTGRKCDGLDPRPDGAARRAGIADGFYVNLGIGIPTLVVELHPAGHERAAAKRERHAGHRSLPYEGDEDPDLINAGKQTVTELADHELLLVRRQLRR